MSRLKNRLINSFNNLAGPKGSLRGIIPRMDIVRRQPEALSSEEHYVEWIGNALEEVARHTWEVARRCAQARRDLGVEGWHGVAAEVARRFGLTEKTVYNWASLYDSAERNGWGRFGLSVSYHEAVNRRALSADQKAALLEQAQKRGWTVAMTRRRAAAMAVESVLVSPDDDDGMVPGDVDELESEVVDPEPSSEPRRVKVFVETPWNPDMLVDAKVLGRLEFARGFLCFLVVESPHQETLYPLCRIDALEP